MRLVDFTFRIISDVRLKRYVEERNELVDELRRVKLQLEEERAHSRGRHANGPTDDSDEVNSEYRKTSFTKFASDSSHLASMNSSNSRPLMLTSV